MTKVLDNFHSPPMVVAPWVDYGNYPTLESLIEKKIIVDIISQKNVLLKLKRKLKYFRFAYTLDQILILMFEIKSM